MSHSPNPVLYLGSPITASLQGRQCLSRGKARLRAGWHPGLASLAVRVRDGQQEGRPQPGGPGNHLVLWSFLGPQDRNFQNPANATHLDSPMSHPWKQEAHRGYQVDIQPEEGPDLCCVHATAHMPGRLSGPCYLHCWLVSQRGAVSGCGLNTRDPSVRLPVIAQPVTPAQAVLGGRAWCEDAARRGQDTSCEGPLATA